MSAVVAGATPRLPSWVVRASAPPLGLSSTSCLLAYGSGVFPQAPIGKSRWRRQPQIDLIRLPPSGQEEIKSGLWRRLAAGRLGVSYTPYVHFPEYCPQEKIKLGRVDSFEKFLSALDRWEPLFLAGRLHKPSLVIQCGGPESGDEELGKLLSALDRNRLQGLRAALVLALPAKKVPFTELMRLLVELSYRGDVRFERSDKASAILWRQGLLFAAMYLPMLMRFDGPKLELSQQLQAAIPEVLSLASADFQQLAESLMERLEGKLQPPPPLGKESLEMMRLLADTDGSAIELSDEWEYRTCNEGWSDSALKKLHESLPIALARESGRLSANERLRRVSPWMLTKKGSMNLALGGPLPFEPAMLDAALRSLTQTASLTAMKEGILQNGPFTSLHYGGEKLSKALMTSLYDLSDWTTASRRR